MKTLHIVLKRENNNFDLIRLTAALGVIFGHSFVLFKNHGYIEPIIYFLKEDYSGSLAVYIFFFLSGLFITKSFIDSPATSAFIIMRIVRIWPALVICIILTAFFVGPLVSKYPLSVYFRDLSVYKYVICNISLYTIKFGLPGVFETNVYPRVVNGSLWTLPFEVRCYLITLAFGLCQIFKNKWVSTAVFALFFLSYAFFPNTFLNLINKQCMFFFTGSFLYLFKNYIFIDYKIFLIFLIIYVAFPSIYVFYVLLCYGVLLLGSSNIFRKIKLPGDYSYGIYIYGFLIQTLLGHLFPKLTWFTSMFISIPCAIIIGILSWHFIEHPSLILGKRISGKLTLNRYREIRQDQATSDYAKK